MTVKWLLHTVLHSCLYSRSIITLVNKTTSDKQLKLELLLPKHHRQTVITREQSASSLTPIVATASQDTSKEFFSMA